MNARKKRYADRFVGRTPSDEKQLEDRQKKVLKISQQTLGKFDQIASQQTLGKFDQIASQQTLGKFDQQPFSSLPLAKALTGNKPFRKRFNRKTLQCAEEKFS